MVLEQLLDRRVVRQVPPDELKTGQGGQLLEPVFLELDAVVVVDVIEPDDLVAAARQPPRQMKADKPGRAGHQDLRHDSLRWNLLQGREGKHAEGRKGAV